MIRVLIVDDIVSTRENLQKLLGFEADVEICGTAENGKIALDEVDRLHPDVILMDVNMPVMDGIQATEALADQASAAPVIIMSVQGDRDYLRRAMQAGAREFLIKPFSHDELMTAIRRVYQLEQKRGTFVSTEQANGSTPAGARGATAGEIVAVFCGKGGVGKTVVASNLAVALAAETGAKVALVDLDLQFGDIGVALNLDYSRSMTDLVEVADNLTPETIEEALADGPGGIKVLLAPISPELADLVTAAHVRTVMAALRKTYDYIVVDTPSHLGDFGLEVIEMASKILVVTSLTIPAIKDTKLTLKVLESLNINPEAIILAVNRLDNVSDFNRSSIEQNLRFPISVQLPYDAKVVADSLNRGLPFVLTHPEAEVSRAVRELVNEMFPSERSAVGAAPEKKKARWFSKSSRQ